MYKNKCKNKINETTLRIQNVQNAIVIEAE